MVKTRLMVVGDIGSGTSDTVWQWLVSHHWPGWRVEVVTADESDIQWGEPPAAVEWTPPWIHTQSIPDAEVTYWKVTSDPRPVLGLRSDADLVVVGRTAKRRTSLLGGTSEWLVHHPQAPLAIIGSGDPTTRVTVCADGSVHAAAALHAFADLPLASGCAVTVLSVDDGRSDADEACRVAVAALEGRVAAVVTEVVKGNPTRAILGHLETAAPDLVVVGTKGLTGWKRIRLGSTAGAVVRSADRNVLVGAADL